MVKKSGAEFKALVCRRCDSAPGACPLRRAKTDKGSCSGASFAREPLMRLRAGAGIRAGATHPLEPGGVRLRCYTRCCQCLDQCNAAWSRVRHAPLTCQSSERRPPVFADFRLCRWRGVCGRGRTPADGGRRRVATRVAVSVSARGAEMPNGLFRISMQDRPSAVGRRPHGSVGVVSRCGPALAGRCRAVRPVSDVEHQRLVGGREAEDDDEARQCVGCISSESSHPEFPG